MPTYKKVGVTAGYEPAGGGFSQYVRVMDWIVDQGVEKIPAGVSFEQASFVEPVNTCLKGVKQLDPQKGDVVVILGQGPIGLIFTMMVARTGARILATDTMASRRALSLRFGAEQAFDPRESGLGYRVKEMTEGRGADLVIIAASAPASSSRRSNTRGRAPAFCCLRKPRTRSESKYPARTSVWANEYCAAPTARPWICRRNRRSWCSAARSRLTS
jgi:threonine dehydrogenase-like Zn-dependent dehydrogenase